MGKMIQQVIFGELNDVLMADDLKEDSNYSSVSSTVSSYLNEIGKYPVLTPEEEKELARKMADGDVGAKEKFIKSNLRLVVYVAKMCNTSKMDFLDIIQEGNLGLLNAVEMFDYTKDVKFSSYAIFWIKYSISRAISNEGDLIRIPINVQELIKKYQSIQNVFYENNMRYATDKEIASEMKISINEVIGIKSFIYSVVSLNIPVSDESNSEFGEFIVDYNPTPEEEIFKNSKRDALSILIKDSKLNEIEECIIKMRYDLENDELNSLKKIAKTLGISQEKARASEARAMKKLRTTALKYEREIFV